MMMGKRQFYCHTASKSCADVKHLKIVASAPGRAILGTSSPCTPNAGFAAQAKMGEQDRFSTLLEPGLPARACRSEPGSKRNSTSILLDSLF